MQEWNWLGIVLVASALILVAGIFGRVFFFGKKSSKTASQQLVLSGLDDESGVEPDSQVLTELGIEVMFNQVNQKVLNHRGNIHRSAMDILLFWESTPGHHKFINVKDLGAGKISINGQVIPATRESAKEGILNVLKLQ